FCEHHHVAFPSLTLEGNLQDPSAWCFKVR
ncbi:MAG: hypothetical protein ACI9OO_001334, partial [Bacteroidia bacterium]